VHPPLGQPVLKITTRVRSREKPSQSRGKRELEAPTAWELTQDLGHGGKSLPCRVTGSLCSSAGGWSAARIGDQPGPWRASRLRSSWDFTSSVQANRGRRGSSLARQPPPVHPDARPH